MRILMLTQFFDPIVGGEERAVEDLATELARRGHEVAVATLHVDGAPAAEERNGVRVHRVEGLVNRLGPVFQDGLRRHLPPAPDPRLVAGLKHVVDEERPDVVHAHNWIVHSYVPIKQRVGAPLVLSLHDYSLACANKRFLHFGAVCGGPGAFKCVRCAADYYGAVKGTLVAGSLLALSPALRRRVDMFLPVSEAVAESLGLARRGLPFEVVPNLVPEPATDAPVDAALLRRLPPDGFLLFLGDASEDKGARVLLDAYAQLESPPPLVFVGRPFILDNGQPPAGVRALGPWPHAAALEAVRRCSMLVVPSLTPETFGLAALEAMSLGRPVVAADTGGLAELVASSAGGRLVPPGDVRALWAAIAELLADPVGREALGRAGRERAAAFAAHAVVPRVERVYRGLVA